MVDAAAPQQCTAAAVIPFPPRDAGRVLESAMRAAEAAAGAALAGAAAEEWICPGANNLAADRARLEDDLEGIARRAAKHILPALTADEEMVDVLARGFGAEALRRLRKRGAL